MKEIELFPALQEMYKDYEIFAEVCIRSKRPDIVLRKGEEITIVEMKTSLNKQLFQQAMHWKYYNISDYIYVAVPKPKRATTSEIMDKLVENGIGVIYVDGAEASIHIQAKKRPNPYKKGIWDKVLLSCYKDTVGGSTAEGGYMTPYKHMINQVKRYLVRVGVPVSTQDIVKQVPEVAKHYSNPIPSLRSALTDYESEWCSRKFIGRKIHFTANIVRTPIKEKKD